ncbi:uncharacterized protein LOC131164300 [Malania oleifera]|uniref:uncharacterized protein LOC131164300 n=1 Tax=Malania oleifera TaxID=397392 RepID=UPI0025AE92D4|nr:uncharacterized protein LOC131164300 [Malania oleifera]
MILEIYAIILLLSSDWTLLWLSKNRNPYLNLIFEAIYSLRLAISDKWSVSMAQFNLINFCLRHRPPKFHNCFGFWKRVEKQQHIYLEDVSTDMRGLIFNYLLEKAKLEGAEELREQRGDGIIGLSPNLFKLKWSVAEVDFDESILLWHMATDLCHYYDFSNSEDAIHNPYIKMSKLLSDYMLYLLVMCPFMLPKGVGQIRFDLTARQAEGYFKLKDIGVGSSRNEACKILIEEDDEDPPPSMILDGCKLAKLLQSEPKVVIETDYVSEEWEKWKIICHVWVEMLCFAANQCEWRYHAQQLGRGGELLTHVSLLMAHFGLTDQMRNATGGTAEDTAGDTIEGISSRSRRIQTFLSFIDEKEEEIKEMAKRRQKHRTNSRQESDSEVGHSIPH